MWFGKVIGNFGLSPGRYALGWIRWTLYFLGVSCPLWFGALDQVLDGMWAKYSLISQYSLAFMICGLGVALMISNSRRKYWGTKLTMAAVAILGWLGSMLLLVRVSMSMFGPI
jgi:hypothetical protein